MHACTPTIDQPTTVLRCVHNHHHHHHHQIMIDDMMMMLHIESNSKLHNKIKSFNFSSLHLVEGRRDPLHLGGSLLFFFFFVFFLLVLEIRVLRSSVCGFAPLSQLSLSLYSLVSLVGFVEFLSFFFPFFWVLNFVKDFFCFEQILFECQDGKSSWT
jgi:hypothetical protein